VLLTIRVPEFHRQMEQTTRWCGGSQARPRSVEILEPVPARIGPRGGPAVHALEAPLPAARPAARTPTHASPDSARV